jgi:hypothetical protein
MSALWNDATCRVVDSGGTSPHFKPAPYSPRLAAFLSLIYPALGGFIHWLNLAVVNRKP